jgi:F420-dependent oxidoreductase-like protein
MGSVDGLPGPTDSWVTLAGLARDTTTIRLGTLVTSATFRLPGPLAISVAQVDAMSDGRVELGLGAGWYEAEHTAYAVPFPSVKERFDRLEDQLAIITGLWGAPPGSTFSHEGHHYSVADSPGLPKPVQRPRPPIIVGGGGPRRTPRLAATYADEYNTSFVAPDVAGTNRDRVRQACEDAGRDPDELVYSAPVTICCGADKAEVARRAAAIGRNPDAWGPSAAGGTPSEVVDRLGQYAAVGIERIYAQILDLDDLDHIRLIAAEVAPHV